MGEGVDGEGVGRVGGEGVVGAGVAVDTHCVGFAAAQVRGWQVGP